MASNIGIELEITVDGERVLLAPVGGPEDYTESVAERHRTSSTRSPSGCRCACTCAPASGRSARRFCRSRRRRAAIGCSRSSAARSSRRIIFGLPHVENMTVTGPFDPTGVRATPPSRQRIFVVPARAGRATRRPARRRSSRGWPVAPTAARSPNPTCRGLLAFYEAGRREASFERGIELALRGILVSPKFVFRVERDPAGSARPAALVPLSDLELASRLSFFLWSSIPDDELLTAASQGKLRNAGGARAAGAAHAGRSPGRGARHELRGAVAAHPEPSEHDARQERFPRLRRQPAAGVRARARAVRRQHLRRGSQRARPDDRRLHLRERAAGEALRHPERLRSALPPRHARPTTRGRGCWARAASCWSPRTPTAPRRWCGASGSSTTCSALPPPPPPADVPPLRGDAGAAPQTMRAADGAAPGESGVRQLPPGDGPAWARAGELRRRRRAGGRGTPARRSMRRASSATAPGSTAPWRCGRRS